MYQSLQAHIKYRKIYSQRDGELLGLTLALSSPSCVCFSRIPLSCNETCKSIGALENVNQ